jgi:hypothetical protein
MKTLEMQGYNFYKFQDKKFKIILTFHRIYFIQILSHFILYSLSTCDVWKSPSTFRKKIFLRVTTHFKVLEIIFNIPKTNLSYNWTHIINKYKTTYMENHMHTLVSYIFVWLRVGMWFSYFSRFVLIDYMYSIFLLFLMVFQSFNLIGFFLRTLILHQNQYLVFL